MTTNRLVLSLVLLGLFAGPRPPAGAADHPRVLLLQSYHPGLSWSADIDRGVRHTLAPRDPGVEIHVEYMDTKRLYSPAYLEALVETYRIKYADLPLDVVVAADNNAFDFAREHRDDLFGAVPLVFCGVNNFDPSSLAGVSEVTGVAEAISFADTFRLALKLHPDTRHLVVFGGSSRTYRLNRTAFQEALEREGWAERMQWREGLPISEIEAQVRALPPATLVFLISTLDGDDGVPLSFGTAADRLAAASPAPVYSMWSFMLGHGVVGGKVVSGFEQGRRAGELAGRILDGTAPADLPVVRESPNPYLFDYRALERFEIPEDRLPEGARVLHRPADFFHAHPNLSWAGVLGVLGLVATTVLVGVDSAHRRRREHEVRETRDFLQRVIDGVADPILVIDTDYAIQLQNRAALAQSPSPNEAPAACHRLSHGRDEPCSDGDHPCPLEIVRKSGLPTRVTHVHRGIHGEAQHLEILASPLFDEDGNVTGIIESARDITPRIRSYQQLEQAKREWERTFDAVPDLIALLDRDSRITRINRPLAERLGVDAEAIRGRPCYEILHGLGAPHRDCPHQRLLDDGREHAAEFQEPRLGGEFLVTASPLDEGGEEPGGAVHVLRDITDLNRARRELEAERNRLAVTLESIGDGVIATDGDGRITLLNPVAEALTGWPRAEAEGRPLAEVFRIIDEHTRAPCGDPLEQVFATGRLVGLADHTLLIARDGTERSVADSAAPIRDRDETLQGAVLVFRDVTSERKAEEELARAQHLESLGILAGGIAHDFNNMLMGVTANLEISRRRLGEDHPITGRLGEALRACFRATDLTRQLLTFARGGEPVKESLHLGPILDEWTAFALRGSGCERRLTVDADLPPLEADPGQVQQVVSNLLINAQQAMPDGGVVEVGAQSVEVDAGHAPPPIPGRYVRLTVADRGHGIAPENLQRIFDPYFTTKATGSGLGLATAYSVVRRHGGHIEAAPNPGGGTIFAVYLPARPNRPVDVQMPLAPAETPVCPLRVLVMDDEELLRDALSDLLEDLGHRVACAPDGLAAVARYENAREEGKPFDVTILDLTVPGGMGGTDTVVRLRDLDPDVRAVASSGYASDPVLANPSAYGFRGVLPKPYRIDQLEEALRQAMGDLGTGDRER